MEALVEVPTGGYMPLEGWGLAADTAPVNVKTVQDDGGVVKLQENQQENKKQANEDRHQGGSAPAGNYLAVFGVEGLKNVS